MYSMDIPDGHGLDFVVSFKRYTYKSFSPKTPTWKWPIMQLAQSAVSCHSNLFLSFILSPHFCTDNIQNFC